MSNKQVSGCVSALLVGCSFLGGCSGSIGSEGANASEATSDPAPDAGKASTQPGSGSSGSADSGGGASTQPGSGSSGSADGGGGASTQPGSDSSGSADGGGGASTINEDASTSADTNTNSSASTCLAAVAPTAASGAKVITLHPSGGDDTSAIQNAINGSSSGDLMIFAAGTFKVGSMLQFAANRSYASTANATLYWTGGDSFLGTLGGDNITVYGITFDGAGLQLGNGSTAPSGLTLANNTFQNCRTSSEPKIDAILVPSGIDNSSVSHNTFLHWTGDDGILVYGPSNTHFDDNVFDDVNEALHIWTAKNVTVLRNNFTKIIRYSLEIQDIDGSYDGGTNLEVAWNYSNAPNAARTGNATMIYSIPTRLFEGLHVHHNYAGGLGLVPIGNDSAATQSWGFELGGSKTECDHNIINGNWATDITTNFQTTEPTIHDNVFAGAKPTYGYTPTEAKSTEPPASNFYNNTITAHTIAEPSAASILSGSYWSTSSCN
jgi:hypothetical protein